MMIENGMGKIVGDACNELLRQEPDPDDTVRGGANPASGRFNVVLFRPEIPQNTGNIGRLCAYTGCRLHLIHPLGFTITDRHLKRSGMDYWKALDVRHHENWEAFMEAEGSPQRIWMCSTRAHSPYWSAQYAESDYFLFGNEGSGCPEWLHEKIGESRKVKIPQFTPGLRSLNLSTSAGIVVYEAMRQVFGLSG